MVYPIYTCRSGPAINKGSKRHRNEGERGGEKAEKSIQIAVESDFLEIFSFGFILCSYFVAGLGSHTGRIGRSGKPTKAR